MVAILGVSAFYIDPLLRSCNAPETTPRVLRQFAALGVLFLGVLAAWQGFHNSRLITSCVFGSLAAVLALVGVVWPLSLRPLFVGAMRAPFPIGRVVSQLFLALLFYGVFAPFGLVRQLVGRDPLCRRARAAASTYWGTKTISTDVGGYLRQT